RQAATASSRRRASMTPRKRPRAARSLPPVAASRSRKSSIWADAQSKGRIDGNEAGRLLCRAGLLLLEALALMRVEIELTEPDRFRRHLDKLVILDPRQSTLQRHADRRGELDGLVFSGGTDVGELLALQHIHFEVVVAGVDADDHPGIHLDA